MEIIIHINHGYDITDDFIIKYWDMLSEGSRKNLCIFSTLPEIIIDKYWKDYICIEQCIMVDINCHENIYTNIFKHQEVSESFIVKNWDELNHGNRYLILKHSKSNRSLLSFVIDKIIEEI